MNKRKKTREYMCPECKGTREVNEETCWYCNGFGIASDEDEFQPFYNQKEEY